MGNIQCLKCQILNQLFLWDKLLLSPQLHRQEPWFNSVTTCSKGEASVCVCSHWLEGGEFELHHFFHSVDRLLSTIQIEMEEKS